MEKVHSLTVVRGFFLLVAAAVLILFWRVINPFILTLVTAGVAAILLAPLDDWLRKKLKYPRLSAILLTLSVGALVVAPVFVVAILMVSEASEIIQWTVAEDSWLNTFSPEDLQVFQILPEVVQQRILDIDLAEVGRIVADWTFSNVGQIFTAAVDVIFKTFIFFIALYYILVDKERIYRNLLEISPFEDRVDAQIIERIATTVRGVVFGALIVAVTQGVFATIGMTIFGVPGAVLWGGLAIIAAQVPMFGVSLIMIPAVAYLFITGDTGAGIGLLIWAVVVVGMVDNILSPLLIEGKTKMNGLLILISILGGLQLFGSIGLIIGPTILAAFMVIIDLYKSGILEQKAVRA